MNRTNFYLPFLLFRVFNSLLNPILTIQDCTEQDKTSAMSGILIMKQAQHFCTAAHLDWGSREVKRIQPESGRVMGVQGGVKGGMRGQGGVTWSKGSQGESKTFLY